MRRAPNSAPWHTRRLERRLDRLIARAENPRKAAAVIATVTTSITVVAGVLMRFVDHDNFPTIGGGSGGRCRR